MKIRVALLVLLLLLTLAGAGAVGYIRSPRFGRLASGMARTALLESGWLTEAGFDLELDPLGLALTVSDLRLAGPGFRLTAPLVELTFSRFGLLSGQIPLRRVLIYAPEAVLSRPPDEGGPTVDRSPAPPPDPWRLLSELPVFPREIEIRGGGIAFEPTGTGMERQRIGRIALTAGLARARRSITASISARMSVRSEPFSLSGRLEAEPGVTRLKDVSAEGAGGRMRLSGALRPDRDRSNWEADARAQADLGRIGRLLGFDLAGQAGVRTRLKGSLPGDFSAGGTASAAGVRVGGVEAGDFSLSFRFADDRLSITDGSAGNRGAAVTIERADLELDGPYGLSIELRIDRADLAELLDTLTVHGAYPTCAVSGAARLEGTLKPLALAGVARLDVRDFVLFDRSWRDSARQTILGFPRALVETPVTIRPEGLEVRSGSVRTPDGRTGIEVTRAFFPFGDDAISIACRAERFDLRDPGPVADFAFEGSGSLDAQIAIGGDVTIDGSIDMHGFSFAGFALGRTAGRARFSAGELRFPGMRPWSDTADCQADVAIDFEAVPGPGLAVVSECRQLPLAEAYTTLFGPDGREWFDGTVGLSVRLQGPPGLLAGRLESRSLGPVTIGDRWDDFELMADLDRSVATIERGRLLLGDGSAELSGTIAPFTTGAIDLTLATRKLRFERFGVAARLLPGLSADADLSLLLRGALPEPELRATLVLSGARWGERPVEPSEVSLSLSGRGFAIDGQLAAGRAVFDLRGAGVSSSDPLSASFSLKEIELLRYLPGLVPAGLASGRLTAEGEVHGVLDGFPAGLRGTIEIGRLTLERPDFTLATAAPFAIRFDGPRGIELPAFRLVRPDRPEETLATIGGRLSGRGTLDLTIGGRLRLPELPLVVGGLDMDDGQLTFDLALGGRWNTPLLSGRLELSGGAARLIEPELRFTEVSGELAVDGGRLSARRLSGRLNGGRFSVPRLEAASGGVEAEALIEGVGMPLWEGVEPLLDGRLRLSGGVLSGRLYVRSLEYRREFDWKRTLVDELLRRQVILRPEGGEPLFRLDLSVTADRTIVIRNEAAEADLSMELQLLGNDIRPVVLGSLFADKGTVTFQGRPFDISSLMVGFRDRERIWPEFDIAAGTTVTRENDRGREDEYAINLRIAGNPSGTTVTISSLPVLSQEDIVSLLITGELASEIGSGLQLATGLNVLSDLTGVNRAIKERFQLERFRITTEVDRDSGTGEESFVPRLEIGKEFARDLRLVYSSTLNEEERRRIELRYRRGDMSLTGRWSSEGDNLFGDFGVDLTFSREFE